MCVQAHASLPSYVGSQVGGAACHPAANVRRPPVTARAHSHCTPTHEVTFRPHMPYTSHMNDCLSRGTGNDHARPPPQGGMKNSKNRVIISFDILNPGKVAYPVYVCFRDGYGLKGLTPWKPKVIRPNPGFEISGPANFHGQGVKREPGQAGPDFPKSGPAVKFVQEK